MENVRFRKIRLGASIGWILFVFAAYCVAYIQYLWRSYPVLQQIQELGIGQILQRFLSP